MLVEMSRELRDQFGTSYASPRSGPERGFVPFCLWELASNALLVEDHEASIEDMKYRVNLERKIHDAKAPIELDTREIKVIAQMVQKVCKLPLLAVQALELLEED